MTLERPPIPPGDPISFGPFTLSPSSRLLHKDGAPVSIGSRALDLLIALVGQAGKLVSKRDLIEQVWPGLTVDDGGLRVHINGLRKVLGDGHDGARYIANVTGRGYAFVAPVAAARGRSPTTAAEPPASLPPSLSRMVGRDDFVQSLASKVLELRFVSLLGPGGIGKTTVAVKAAHQLRDEFEDRIHFIALSLVSDPGLLHVTIASMLGLDVSVGDPVLSIVGFLRRKRSLVVLDSCEHLIEPVAALADAIFRQAPDAHVLATTREALRVEGEHVVRLAPLDCPPEGRALTAAESLAYPAVELFVERARASSAAFRLQDEDAPLVAQLCRKLDGLPLAIELGAGRIDAYGLAETAQLLDSRLGGLWEGQRLAPPRHQTLNATLDWSFGLLTPDERIVFERISIFASPFTLEAARAVAADENEDRIDVPLTVGSLVAKSLVATAAIRGRLRYRLLDTTRAYAQNKLKAADVRQAVARRHALFFADKLANADRDFGAAGEFLESLNDVRAALEWSFHPGGDAAIGVRLAVHAADAFLEHALLGECLHWTERAIASLDEAQRGSAAELTLQTSLSWSALFATGKREATLGAFLRGLEILRDDADPRQQLRLLSGLIIISIRKSDYEGALALAEQAATIARRTADEAVIALAHWELGGCHHLIGRYVEALKYCETAVRPPSSLPRLRNIADYGYDNRGRALITRARSLWLLGYPDQAVVAARFAIDAAEDVGNPISLCFALLYCATVFIWTESWSLADEATGRLVSHSRDHKLMYLSVGVALQEISKARRGGAAVDVQGLRRSLEDIVRDGHLVLAPMCWTTMAEALANAGRPEAAKAVIDRAEQGQVAPAEGIDAPEILRVKGVVTAALGQDEAGVTLIQSAKDLARRQSALSWELRAATSLARLKAARGEDAAGVLAPVYARFVEGFETGDVKAARRLLESLKS